MNVKKDIKNPMSFSFAVVFLLFSSHIKVLAFERSVESTAAPVECPFQVDPFIIIYK